MSASPSPSPRSRGGRSVDRDAKARDDNVGTMFVGNLNHETSERRLRDFFETYGRVLSAKVSIPSCPIPHCLARPLPALVLVSRYAHG